MATKLAPFPSALFPRGSSPPQPRDRATEARNKEGAPRTAPSHPRTPNRAPSSSSLEPEPCSPRHGPPSFAFLLRTCSTWPGLGRENPLSTNAARASATALSARSNSRKTATSTRREAAEEDRVSSCWFSPSSSPSSFRLK
ncbi:unnamed protein product [Ectocarpus sp. 12 AP-2014]